MKKQYIRPAMQVYQLGLDESILMNVSGGSTDDRWSNSKEWGSDEWSNTDEAED